MKEISRENLENNMAINFGQQRRLQNKAKLRVISILRGKIKWKSL